MRALQLPGPAALSCAVCGQERAAGPAAVGQLWFTTFKGNFKACGAAALGCAERREGERGRQLPPRSQRGLTSRAASADVGQDLLRARGHLPSTCNANTFHRFDYFF